MAQDERPRNVLERVRFSQIVANGAADCRPGTINRWCCQSRLYTIACAAAVDRASHCWCQLEYVSHWLTGIQLLKFVRDPAGRKFASSSSSLCNWPAEQRTWSISTIREMTLDYAGLARGMVVVITLLVQSHAVENFWTRRTPKRRSSAKLQESDCTGLRPL